MNRRCDPSESGGCGLVKARPTAAARRARRKATRARAAPAVPSAGKLSNGRGHRAPSAHGRTRAGTGQGDRQGTAADRRGHGGHLARGHGQTLGTADKGGHAGSVDRPGTRAPAAAGRLGKGVLARRPSNGHTGQKKGPHAAAPY